MVTVTTVGYEPIGNYYLGEVVHNGKLIALIEGERQFETLDAALEVTRKINEPEDE